MSDAERKAMIRVVYDAILGWDMKGPLGEFVADAVLAHTSSVAMTERARCARVADETTKVMVDWHVPGLVDAHEPTVRAIVANIRNGAEHDHG